MNSAVIIRLREMYKREARELMQNISNLVIWRAGTMDDSDCRFYDTAIEDQKQRLNMVMDHLSVLE